MAGSYNHLITLPLQEVVEVLNNRGMEVKLLETHPPRKSEGRGIKRILALQRDENSNTINIIWSHELYF